MNNPLIFTVVLWKTRNEKRAEKAKELCKNYDVHRLIGDCYVGKLKKKEQNQVKKWFEEEFTNKTDLFYLLCVCKNCHKESVIYEVVKKVVDKKPFEII